MSIRVLWSGPPAVTRSKERFQIQATPAALTALGKIMCSLKGSTGISVHKGYGEEFPINVSGLKFFLQPDGQKLRFDYDGKALGIFADEARFKILGESLINSYDDEGLPGFTVRVETVPGSDFLLPTNKQLSFKSVRAQAPVEPSGWFDAKI